MWGKYPEIRCRTILAPLAGYTDEPFRAGCRRNGCYFAYAPMVDARSLIHGNPRNTGMLFRSDFEPWLGAQLLGGDPTDLVKAGKILNDRDFDSVDLNLGCPVPKVLKRGAGAALAEDSDRAKRCVEALVSVCERPVTAKIRILSAEDPRPTVELAAGLAECGISGITVHGRLRQSRYSAPVACDVIAAVAAALSIPVVANGGVFDRSDALDLRECTGCDSIMVARGAIGNPWIFREIMSDVPCPPPTHLELCNELEQHVVGMVGLYGERIGMLNARKIILAYLKGRGYRRKRRAEVADISTIDQFARFLQKVRAEGPSPGACTLGRRPG